MIPWISLSRLSDKWKIMRHVTRRVIDIYFHLQCIMIESAPKALYRWNCAAK